MTWSEPVERDYIGGVKSNQPIGPCNPPVVKDNAGLVDLGELLEQFCERYLKRATKSKESESPSLGAHRMPGPDIEMIDRLVSTCRVSIKLRPPSVEVWSKC